MIVQRDAQPESPRLHVSFLGREYTGARGSKSYTITSTLTNLYDGWTLDLPIVDGLVNDEIPGLLVHRWIPGVLSMADPAVDASKAVPVLQGVITRCEHHTSAEASVLRLSGFDLGKLLESCARPWLRLRGLTMGGVLDKLLDPSWRRQNRKDGWGFQGIRGLNGNRITKLGRNISGGRAQVQINLGAAFGTLIPPIQTEVGERVGDIVSRYARLTGITASTGSFVNVSADGFIQVFNPDDTKDDEPLYVFNYHNGQENTRIKSGSLIQDGEDLYSEYWCYSSIIQPPQALAANRQENFNAGRFRAINNDNADLLGPPAAPIFRRLTFGDPEQYEKKFAQARADWRKRQSLYREKAVKFVVQGHSWAGPNKAPIPIVEGNIAEVNSDRLKVFERMIIESVVKRQSPDRGTETEITLHPRGLLAA